MTTTSFIWLEKLNYFRVNRHRIVQKRFLKYFNQEHFIEDLRNVPWDNIQDVNPNHRWEKWKTMFFDIVDNHAPLKRGRLRNKKSPWLSKEIISLMRKRDVLKQKVINTKEPFDWIEYKRRATPRTMPSNKPRLSITKIHVQHTETIQNNCGTQSMKYVQEKPRALPLNP